MKKMIQRAGILFLIFLAATVMYFLSSRKTMEKEYTVYSSMDEATLPVVYTDFQGQAINCLRGYKQDMGNQTARESLIVLPEDRRLSIQIHEYGNTITGIRYEVRDLSMERLIERTELEQWDSGEGVATAILPIQNLLTRNETYLLSVFVSTAEEEITYYTRIMWADDSSRAADMLKLADEFTRKSLIYDQAGDLVAYLETNDSEDNSSLGHVTIRTSFQHLTWDGLPVELVGEPQITLQEFDGIMGHIQTKYQVRIPQSDGTELLVNAEDNFTMKWNEQRIYLMNYERNAEELFKGEDYNFSGKRIILGISSDEKVRTMKSPNSRYLAFKNSGNLWSYDQNEKKAVCIFSFYSKTDDGVRSGYDNHDVKLLSVGDNGNVGFLVYGYMNRGSYEGRTGVVFYTYDSQKNTVQERFFIPAAQSCEQMEADIDSLAYLSANQMVYLMLGGNVYGIDLNSNESLTVARGLTEGSYAVSENGSRFAWQEGGSLYEAEKVQVMDFETSQNQEITGAEGDYVRVLGFVGDDLIYGLGRSEDTWIVNGREKGLPMYAMYIVDSQMQVASQYQKEGIYISDVVAEDGRIHLKQLVRLAQNQYSYQADDTIVCNEKLDDDPLKGIGWYASQDRGKVYFVQADSEIKASGVKTDVPEAFSYENTSTLTFENGSSRSSDGSLIFYAYGGGHYLGASRSFSEAVNMAYGKMGFVTDNSQQVLWDRVNRQPARIIREPVEAARRMTKYLDTFSGSTAYEDGLRMIDAGGCSLSQVLYFIDKGIPVIAYVEEGRLLLLCGYDQYNVTLYDPSTQETWKMGLGDAGAYFDSQQNDFICGLSVE